MHVSSCFHFRNGTGQSLVDHPFRKKGNMTRKCEKMRHILEIERILIFLPWFVQAVFLLASERLWRRSMRAVSRRAQCRIALCHWIRWNLRYQMRFQNAVCAWSKCHYMVDGVGAEGTLFSKSKWFSYGLFEPWSFKIPDERACDLAIFRLPSHTLSSSMIASLIRKGIWEL